MDRLRRTPIILALCFVLLAAQYFFGEGPKPNTPLAGHVLEISAKRDAWLVSIVDEVDDKRVILKAGESIRFDFAKSLVLHVDDPGAFRMVYDGSLFKTGDTTQTILRFPPARD